MTSIKKQICLFRNRWAFINSHKSLYLSQYRICEDPVLDLDVNEIFVFGSNLRGAHGGGAAGYALKEFNASLGRAVGRTGKCYAIPTLGYNYEKLSLDYISNAVQHFITYAKKHPELTFKVSAIGCGIAGFTPQQIAPMFRKAIKLKNVALPREFWDELINPQDL